MENAVDALKLGFAVLVFAIALVLTFSVIGQARATSDIVLTLNDKTNLYDYVDVEETNAKQKDRIVGFETVLPTIYRYAKEQYAVTILDTDATPIVRFDLYTEGFMNDWNEIIRQQNNSNLTNERFKEIKHRIGLVDNFILEEFKKDKKTIYSENPIWDSMISGQEGSYSAKELYKGSSQNNRGINVTSPWMGNPNVDTIERIKADLNGTNYTKNGVSYFGKNLEQYKNRTFKEKFLEIQTSGITITQEDSENNIQYSLETVRGNKKLEIIYILQ